MLAPSLPPEEPEQQKLCPTTETRWFPEKEEASFLLNCLQKNFCLFGKNVVTKTYPNIFAPTVPQNTVPRIQTGQAHWVPYCTRPGSFLNRKHPHRWLLSPPYLRSHEPASCPLSELDNSQARKCVKPCTHTAIFIPSFPNLKGTQKKRWWRSKQQKMRVSVLVRRLAPKKKKQNIFKKTTKKAHFKTLSQKNYRKKHILTTFGLQITKKKNR